MARTVAPALGNVRCGPGGDDLFDYYPNATRLLQGNPVVLHRHGGGGNLGFHQDARIIYTFPVNGGLPGETWYFYHWLRGAWAAFGQSPSLPWDLITFSSGQRSHESVGGTEQDYTPVPAAHRSILMPDQIRECQRNIATIKRMAGLTISGVKLGFDPNRGIGYGESYGATLHALAQLAPPISSNGGHKTWYDGIYTPGTHDSRLRGCVLWEPQIKCDITYMWAALNYSGWFGGRSDSSSAQDQSVFGAQLRWTEATRLLDVSGTWHRNAFSGLVVADRVNLRGVNCAAGVYIVEQINSSQQIKLTTSPGASAFFIGNCNWGNTTRILTTATPNAFSSMEAGDKIWITAGTGVTLGEYTVEAVLSGTTIKLTADINGAGGNIGDNSVQFFSGYYGGAQMIEHAGPQIRDMASIVRYFENNDIDFYPGFYSLYPAQGSHVQPFTNPHDSAQHTDLQTAIVNAGLQFNGQLLTAGDLDASAFWADGGSVATSALSTALYNRYLAIEAWMASQVN